MKLMLYYAYDTAPATYGGCYSEWVTLLAMIPLGLTMYRWRIYKATVDTIMVVIEML